MVQVLQRSTSLMKMLRGGNYPRDRQPLTPGTPQQQLPALGNKVVRTPILVEEKHVHPTTPRPEPSSGSNKLTRMWQNIRRRGRDESAPRHGSASFVLHGEDAMAVGPLYHIVADGISTTTHHSTSAAPSLSPSPSAVLARALVHAVEHVLLHDPPPSSLADFEHMVIRGILTAQALCQHVSSTMGSTLVVALVHAKHLFTFSIGDSKCLVLRKGRIVYETLAVMKEFNVPWTVTHHALRPHMYVVQRIPLKKLDIVLSFSDGFGDNVYKDDLVNLLHVTATPSDKCHRLLQHARALNDVSKETAFPFSAAAAAAYVARAKEDESSEVRKLTFSDI
ncbi:hypothetical protein, variant [Aphanomyces invadans]|uniref:Protein phosphatase n=1 Tax=Aphanomyces invadans TaxID=157072 RepID=A0A024TDK6_9STRA|nr:hypothetical protein, variant [Aphanomyces invadans]ETV92089.1 hypothetical protein, variant [Aphanomyces invadans]|eukprot:XP_008879251.1 hypothetical protein, variant [Aphanomyces invadans]